MKDEWYEIRVRGHLSSGWSNWFQGLDVEQGPDGESILSGPLPDQSALHGVLEKIRDLNLDLISVSRRARGQVDDGHQGNHPASAMK